MGAARKSLSEAVATEVLVASRRRCCLCYYLENRRGVCKGQIAHLNRRRDDDRVANLVWLCFDHHEDYDSRNSQSKGFTLAEVRTHRDRLITEMHATKVPSERDTARDAGELVSDSKRHPWRHPWHYPLWQVANKSDLFAFTAPAADGICAIERINLPDGRIVIACIQVPGNPGNSITNCAEYIFEQVCERFDFPRDKVVWLENYEDCERDEWRLVRFSFASGCASDPEWTTLTPPLWADLSLSPKKRLAANGSGELGSKLRKSFPWPPVSSALGLDG